MGVLIENRKGKHLSLLERKYIYNELRKDTSVEDIAKGLNRSPRTIYREILMYGETTDDDNKYRSYNYILAHKQYEERKKQRGKKSSKKLRNKKR